MLCEAVDVRSGQRVLDVAAGNGNATLAAARRFAEVVSTDYVGALLERGTDAIIAAESQYFMFRYRSPEHLLEVFRSYYGPVHKAFAAIDPQAREWLKTDLYTLIDEFNVAADGTLVVPSEYLEVVITRR